MASPVGSPSLLAYPAPPTQLSATSLVSQEISSLLNIPYPLSLLSRNDKGVVYGVGEPASMVSPYLVGDL